jgi:hypothetical protein
LDPLLLIFVVKFEFKGDIIWVAGNKLKSYEELKEDENIDNERGFLMRVCYR